METKECVRAVQMVNQRGHYLHLLACFVCVCISGAVFLYEIGTKLLTTCKDDRLRVWDLKTGSDFSSPKASQQVRHNNNTGRWLTAFKANWIPASDDHFVVGTFVYES